MSRILFHTRTVSAFLHSYICTSLHLHFNLNDFSLKSYDVRQKSQSSESSVASRATDGLLRYVTIIWPCMAWDSTWISLRKFASV